MDTVRLFQEVVERIAAPGRDDHHVIVRTDLKRHPVQTRIFPTSVVYELTTVTKAEYAGAEELKQHEGLPWPRMPAAANGVMGTDQLIAVGQDANSSRATSARPSHCPVH